MKKPIRTILSSAIAALIATSVAQAGSFSLYTEGTGAAAGNYAAGIAAEAADASTGWYNPAGLALLHDQQLVIGGAGVFPKSSLVGTSTFRTPLAPPFVQSFNGINGGNNALVPSMHYARPLGENATFGLSIVSPFGLSTNWGLSSPVRYAATNSELLTTIISPELGGRLSEHFAVGAGLDFQYARVKFNQVIGSPALLSALNANPTLFDSVSYNTGDSVGMGFHVGGMIILNDNHSRIGVNYQSRVTQKFNGTSRLHGRLADPALADSNAVFRSNHLSSNEIEFPDILTISGYHDVNDRLALLTSVVYTGWKSLRTIELDKVAAFNPALGQVLTNSVSTENYRNAWRVSAGANYKLNPKWKLRVGGGYDQTPTTNQDRDIRVADSNRWALSAGTHYQARPNVGIDVGYTHLFSTGAVIVNKTQALGTSSYNVNASASGSADLVGLQLTWLIDHVETPAATK